MTIIREAGAGGVKATGSRLRIRIINAGRGSSGVYPESALKAAAESKVFGKGTHMYMDHPGLEESWDRPERSVKDLAAVLDGDAEWNATEKALEADARVFGPYREAIAEMAEDIGVSIRAQAEVDDSSGTPIIQRITAAESIDFVTKAGRGGKVLQVLESARQRPVKEAVSSDVRSWLSRAVQAAAGPDRYTWVRDHDDDFVYYETDSGAGRPAMYRQSYSLGDGDVALGGEPEEVNAETTYKPVSSPAPTPDMGTTTESKEDQMPNIQEGKTTDQAVSEAARIAELENAVQESRQAIENGKAQVRKANSIAAELVVAEAFDGIDAPKARQRLVESAVADAGDSAVDLDAVREAARASAAEFETANGAGQPVGLGATITESGADISDDDILATLKGIN